MGQGNQGLGPQLLLAVLGLERNEDQVHKGSGERVPGWYTGGLWIAHPTDMLREQKQN